MRPPLFLEKSSGRESNIWGLGERNQECNNNNKKNALLEGGQTASNGVGNDKIHLVNGQKQYCITINEIFWCYVPLFSSNYQSNSYFQNYSINIYAIFISLNIFHGSIINKYVNSSLQIQISMLLILSDLVIMTWISKLSLHVIFGGGVHMPDCGGGGS